MAEKVHKTGVSKEKGYLYFVTKEGHVGRAKMARGKKGGRGEAEVVKECGVQKEKGYLYFIDKDGDIGRAPMARRSK